ncbi:unnamed protein product [Prorocentrum cordatum]|uniref:Uncharacterized protein n=1 Tax=Prorocentrum cordatum TaxID=2364126 RepID=A0ABN9U2K4_9DINO|nr:unnamed protein product [Polarella glacialis]
MPCSALPLGRSIQQCCKSSVRTIEDKEPFFAKGGTVKKLDWDDISELRVPLKHLEKTLEQHTDKRNKRAIIISVNEHEMQAVEEVVQKHNAKDGFTEVDAAWATKDDVY